jgi:hypothetical protein
MYFTFLTIRCKKYIKLTCNLSVIPSFLDQVYGIRAFGFEGLTGIASIGCSPEKNSSEEKANLRLLTQRFKGDRISKRCLHHEKTGSLQI